MSAGRLAPAAVVLTLSLASSARGGPSGEQCAKNGAEASRKSPLPRTPDGHPDLQGTYDLGHYDSLRAVSRRSAGSDQGTGGETTKGRKRAPIRECDAIGSESPSAAGGR